MFLILLTIAITVFALRTVMVHIVPYAIDKGITPSVAALAVATIGGCSIVGRIVMGSVQDKIGAQRSMIICLVVQGFTMLALPFLGSDSLFFVYAVLFGFTYGGDVPQFPAITAQCFGMASVSILYPLLTAGGNIGGALGPVTAGYVFDATGSYTAVFLGTGISLFAAVFCILRLRARTEGIVESTTM